MENLEYSAISLKMENSGNSVQLQGRVVLVRHSNTLCKTAVDWVKRIVTISDEDDEGH